MTQQTDENGKPMTYWGGLESKNQTAVEWLVEQMINQMGIRIENTEIGIQLFQQANAIFEQQIIDVVVWFDDTERTPSEIETDAEQYYNETFKSE